MLLNSVGQKNSYHLWHNTWHLVVNWHLVKTKADTWYLAIKGVVSKTVFSCVLIVWADQVVIIIGTTCLLACLRSVGLVLFWVLSVLSAVCLIACDMLDWFLFRFGRYCLLVSVGTVCARGFFLGCLRTVMGTVRRCTPRHWFVNVQTHLKAGVCTPALARPSFGLKRTHRIVPCRARANNCCNVARCHQTGSHAGLPSTCENRCIQSTSLGLVPTPKF